MRGGVLILAGGTGGHIYPGLALAETLQAHDIAVRWLGADGGMECDVVTTRGIPLDRVRIAAVRGKGLKSWVTLPVRLWLAVAQARQAIARHTPACAVSFGGYVAGPGGLAAWSRGVPLIVHEQNRIPGLTNRVLARLARTVLQAFPGTFEGRAARTCGNPVRSDVASLPSPESRFRDRTGPARLLVTGGSQGARALNETVPRALAELESGCRPEVLHQSGRHGLEATQALYASLNITAEVTPFIEDMAEAYAWADLVVCRSGALTVSELAAAGIGSVLVPYPHAVDDHQAANAQYLVDAGAAQMVREASLDPSRLAGLLAGLFGNRGQLLAMAVRARKVAVPDASERVLDACREWLQ